MTVPSTSTKASGGVTRKARSSPSVDLAVARRSRGSAGAAARSASADGCSRRRSASAPAADRLRGAGAGTGRRGGRPARRRRRDGTTPASPGGSRAGGRVPAPRPTRGLVSRRPDRPARSVPGARCGAGARRGRRWRPPAPGVAAATAAAGGELPPVPSARRPSTRPRAEARCGRRPRRRSLP